MLKQILSAFSITALASLFSLVFSVVTNKILAVALGPIGIGYWSILNQIFNTVVIAGTLGGGGALVQGLAARKDRGNEANFLAAVTWVYLITTLITAGVLGLFHQQILLWMFDDDVVPFRSSLIGWFAVPLIFSVINGYLSAIVNAKRDISWLAVTQIGCAAMAAILAHPLALMVQAGYWETFIVFLTVTNGVATLLSLYKCVSKRWARFTLFVPIRVALREVRTFLLYSFGVFGAGLVSNLTILSLRSLIIDAGGPEAVGYFQASWGISMNYIMVILSSMGTYYLPTLSGADSKGQRGVFQGVLLVIVSLAIPLVILMISIKPLLISLLFSRDFLPTLGLLRWMLVGDFLKAISWCFGLVLLANGNIRIFFAKEVFLNLWFLGTSFLLIKYLNGVEYIGLAFVSMYLINLAFLAYYVRRRYGLVPPPGIVYLAASGLILILLTSLATWNLQAINLPQTFVSLLAGIILVLISYRKWGGQWLAREEGNKP